MNITELEINLVAYSAMLYLKFRRIKTIEVIVMFKGTSTFKVRYQYYLVGTYPLLQHYGSSCRV